MLRNLRWLLCGIAVLVTLRADAATFVVNSTGDHPAPCDGTGECTFREAFVGYFARGVTRIEFAIPGPGPHTITLTSDLTRPAMYSFMNISGLTIDGYTQPGSQPNTAAVGTNAVLKIVIDGNGFAGPVVASNNVFRGLVLQRFGGPAITIKGDDNVVAGCFIGTDASGTAARGNGIGLLLRDPQDDPFNTLSYQDRNRIGGSALADRNLISGNSEVGINARGTYLAGAPPPALNSHETVIEGNLIGTSALGTSAIPNRAGVLMDLPWDAVIRRNVVSGNTTWAIGIRGVHSGNPRGDRWIARRNTIVGNLVGTNATGDSALPNGGGIYIGNFSYETRIGGTTPAERNVISGNLARGVVLESSADSAAYAVHITGNFIGSDVSGNRALPNGQMGIDVVNTHALIGGADAGSGNVIVGNGPPAGVAVRTSTAILYGVGSRVIIRRNLVGVGLAGAAIGNNGDGVKIFPPDGSLVSDHTVIGDLDPALGNIIENNSGAGVSVLGGSSNAILSNSIGPNGGVPIDLGGDGPTPNDALDADSGPNGLQNYPFVTSVISTAGTVHAVGSLDSSPSTPFLIQLFDGASPSRMLASANVTTDAAGRASFDAVLSGMTDGALSATATNMTTMATSEMSPRFAIAAEAVPLASTAGLTALAALLALAGTLVISRRC